MSKLSSKTSSFFYKHRNHGIPNLMLWIGIANVVIYVLYLLNRSDPLFYWILRYDHVSIFQNGQVWRLFTYPFLFLTERAMGSSFGVFWGAIGLLFYWYCGRVIEANWGSLKFNLYYLAGLLLTDAAAAIIGFFGSLGPLYSATVYYLNMSLFFAVATFQPEAMVRVYFVIPLKMKWLAWVDLGFIIYEIVRNTVLFGFLSLVWLMPIMALCNYLLFFRKDVVFLLPGNHVGTRSRTDHAWRPKAAPRQSTQTHARVHVVQPYRFKCTVCGRTDVSDPKLEFRYCSRCAGYRCYCMDHINNHAHITE